MVDSSDRILDARKQKVLDFLRSRKIVLISYALLFLIILLGYSLRTTNVDSFKDVTTGKYIPIDLDAMLFLRYADYIAEHGQLFDRDPLRYYPEGWDMTTFGSFTSYFVVYLSNFLRVFSSKFTVDYVHVLYPPISLILISVVLFLLVRRLFDWRVALLSTLFLNVVPAFLFRTTAGLSDHDALAILFTLATFYLFVRAWQSEKISSVILFGILASITTALGKITANTTQIIYLVFGLFVILEIFLNKFAKKDYVAYASWILPLTLYILLFEKFGGLPSYLTTLVISVSYFAFLLATIDYVLFHLNLFGFREKIGQKIPSGVVSFVVTAVVSGIALLTIEGPAFIASRLESVSGLLFRSFAESRWALTVAESRRAYVTDLFSSFGKLYFYFFMIGSVILFYDAVKALKRPKLLTSIYSIFIFSFVFARYSSSSILNGQSPFARFLLVWSALLFLAFIAIAYLRAFYRHKESYQLITHIDKKHAFVLLWFTLLTLAATSAIRLHFEFAPVTTVLAAFFIIASYDFISRLRHRVSRIALWCILFLLLFSPFTFFPGVVYAHYTESSNQAKYYGPIYNQRWQTAGAWARGNLPETAVFAHWWDYGYLVQTGFERATLTDGGNLGGYALNHFMGRHVLTGRNETEALPFLKAKNATHFLVISDEVGKYPAFSSIGSDVNYDRYSWIPAYTFDPSKTYETRNQTVLVYVGGTPLDSNLVFNDVVYPANSAAIAGFFVPTTENNGQLSIAQPFAKIVYNANQVDVPLSCVYLGGQEITYDNGLDACLMIIPRVTGDGQANAIGSALYLSPKVRHTLFTKLYLFGRDSPNFKLVYTDEANIPLAMYNGALFGPLKIWEITYPEHLEVPDYFYTNTLPDPRVSRV